MEDEIIDAQPADSDFGKVRDEFKAADKKYQDARKSVLETDDYKDQLERPAIRTNRLAHVGPEKGV